MKRSNIRRVTGVVGLLILFTCLDAGAQGRFGAGFVFGEPTGISWKYRIDRSNAVDGAIGFSPYDRWRLHVDYLWHTDPFNDPRLNLHYGIGTALGFGRTDYVITRSGRNTYVLRSQEVGLGVRGVLGLTYVVPKTPLDLFLEIAPLMVLTPAGGMGLDVGFGGRFYF